MVGVRGWGRTPWRLTPHAVLALFCAGLVCALLAGPPVGAALAVGAAAALGVAGCALAGRARAALVLLGLAALAVGMGWGGARLAATAAPDLDLPTPVRGTVVLDTPPVEAPFGGFRARGVVERLAAEHGAVPPGTRLLIDLPEGRPPAVGTRLRVDGPVRSAARPDSPGWWRRWLERQGIAGRLRVAVVRAEGRRGGLAGLRDRWREWVTARAGAGLGGDRAALVRGMALGGGEGLSEEAGQAFRDAGLWHLLAVSGQNVAVVAIAVLAGLGALGVRRRGAVAGAALVMCAYCLACDGGASVARAGLVGALGLLAELRSAPRERWYLLLAGLAVLLAHQPRALWDPGLQLSFAAVVGLFAVAPPLAGWLRGWLPGRVADLAALAAAAGLATAPVVVGAFGRLSLAGLVLNVVAVPLAAPVVVLALAGIAAGALVPAAGVALAGVAGLGAQALLWGARAGAAVPGAAVDVPPGAAPLVALAALVPVAAWGFARPGGLGFSPRALPWRAILAVGVALGGRRMGADAAGAPAAVAGAGHRHGPRHRPGRRDPAAQPRGRGRRGGHRPARGARAGGPGGGGPAAGGGAPAGRPGADPRLPRSRGRGGGRAGAHAGGRPGDAARPGRRVAAPLPGGGARGARAGRAGARDPGRVRPGPGAVAGAGAVARRGPPGRRRPQPVQPGGAGLGRLPGRAADRRRRERRAGAPGDRLRGRAQGVPPRLRGRGAGPGAAAPAPAGGADLGGRGQRLSPPPARRPWRRWRRGGSRPGGRTARATSA